MKLNHAICPNCGHDFYESESVKLVCDACGQEFHLSKSKTSQRPETVGEEQAMFHAKLSEQLN